MKNWAFLLGLLIVLIPVCIAQSQVQIEEYNIQDRGCITSCVCCIVCSLFCCIAVIIVLIIILLIAVLLGSGATTGAGLLAAATALVTMIKPFYDTINGICNDIINGFYAVIDGVRIWCPLFLENCYIPICCNCICPCIFNFCW